MKPTAKANENEQPQEEPQDPTKFPMRMANEALPSPERATSCTQFPYDTVRRR